MEDAFIYLRNQNIAIANPSVGLDYVDGTYPYTLKVFLNLTNFAFRPNIYNVDGGFALIAVAYYFSGVSMLYMLFLLIRRLRLKPFESDVVEISAVLFFSSLFIVSLSPLIQPRYLLPASVICFISLLKCGVKLKGRDLILIYIISAVATLTYYIYGIPFPPATMIIEVVN